MKKKLILVLIVVSAVCSFGAWRMWTDREPDSRGRIFVSGNMEAIEVDLAFRIAGQIMTLPIEEGDRLKKGQVVSTLDTDTLLALKGAAEAESATARAALDELEAGTREEEIAMARARLRAAESRLKNAKDEFDRHSPLFKQGAISASTFDARLTALNIAMADMNDAKERLRELEKGPREQRIRAAQGRLARAEWEKKKIVLDLEHSVLTTPISGVILVKSNEVGEVVLPSSTVATVAHLGEVWLKGYVAENNLGRIKLGQKVEVTTDTYPNKIYLGKITFISSRAEFTPKNVQTREERIKQVYRIKVTIPNPSHELKIGMPAEGYILTGEEADPKRSGLKVGPSKSSNE